MTQACRPALYLALSFPAAVEKGNTKVCLKSLPFFLTDDHLCIQQVNLKIFKCRHCAQVPEIPGGVYYRNRFGE